MSHFRVPSGDDWFAIKPFAPPVNGEVRGELLFGDVYNEETDELAVGIGIDGAWVPLTPTQARQAASVLLDLADNVEAVDAETT